MSETFEYLRQSARDSWLIRRALATAATLGRARESSAVGAAFASAAGSFAATTPAARVQWFGTAIAVAAAGHLLLRLILPATVAPALPALFIAGVAAFAALAAWQAAAVVAAWEQSRLGRIFR
jgi:hypothetical protein